LLKAGDNVRATMTVSRDGSCECGFQRSDGSVAVTSSPRNGSASAQGNACSYRPRPGFTGTDSFTLVRRWPEGGQATVSFAVTVVNSPAPKVAAAPDPPQVPADAAPPSLPPTAAAPPPPAEPPCTLPMGAVNAHDGTNVQSAMRLASNSQCRTRWNPKNNRNLAIALKSSARNGSVAIEGTSVLYKPNPGFNGADSFVISVQWTTPTGQQRRGTATYHVTVQ
jgi:hypothetical protein